MKTRAGTTTRGYDHASEPRQHQGPTTTRGNHERARQREGATTTQGGTTTRGNDDYASGHDNARGPRRHRGGTTMRGNHDHVGATTTRGLRLREGRTTTRAGHDDTGGTRQHGGDTTTRGGMTMRGNDDDTSGHNKVRRHKKARGVDATGQRQSSALPLLFFIHINSFYVFSHKPKEGVVPSFENKSIYCNSS